MKRRAPGLHPCLGVPRQERQRLALIGRLALAELHAGEHAKALVELHAVALVAVELLAAERFDPDARQAAQEAAQAIAAARVGTTLPAAAIAPASTAVELLEQVLPHVTWRTLAAAKDAAGGRC